MQLTFEVNGQTAVADFDEAGLVSAVLSVLAKPDTPAFQSAFQSVEESGLLNQVAPEGHRYIQQSRQVNLKGTNLILGVSEVVLEKYDASDANQL